MIESGETAPAITAPVASDDIETFDLSTARSEGPLVLAFFPGAFTSVCRSELNAFDERLDEFESIGARVLGISRDSPFALEEFRDRNDLGFDLISDLNGGIVTEYGVTTDFDDIGLHDVAKRAVFVIEETGTVTYAWSSDDPGVEPDYDEVLEAARAAAD